MHFVSEIFLSYTNLRHSQSETPSFLASLFANMLQVLVTTGSNNN